jgi:hypothetical protein
MEAGHDVLEALSLFFAAKAQVENFQLPLPCL